jgi:hypothetical protein
MDEHNITQTTKKEQAFFSKISNRKCYCSWKWVIKIEQKIKWKKFQFGLLLIKICTTKTRLIWLENENELIFNIITHDTLNNEYNHLA